LLLHLAHFEMQSLQAGLHLVDLFEQIFFIQCPTSANGSRSYRLLFQHTIIERQFFGLAAGIEQLYIDRSRSRVNARYLALAIRSDYDPADRRHLLAYALVIVMLELQAAH